MKLIPVESSMLLAVGYDAEAKELEAVFSSGQVWRYRDVPRKVYRELLAAASKGSYMRSCIIGTYADYRLRRRRTAGTIVSRRISSCRWSKTRTVLRWIE